MNDLWELTVAEEAQLDRDYWEREPDDEEEDDDPSEPRTHLCDCGSCCWACGHDSNCQSQQTRENDE
ncbi:hypothetical protein ACFWDI_28305 [Streptomyces sp. NPDC060064]|uniref:hypothetical protein n=1 Tax=Streptomyces sp. NPDC060064 TaxID=3347049 RepID=UPI0036A14EE0